MKKNLKVIIITIVFFVILPFSVNSQKSIITTISSKLVDVLVHENNFYISTMDGEVVKIDLMEGSPTPKNIITGLSIPAGMAIKEGELYISDFNDGKILKINLNEEFPNPVDVLTNLNNPFGLAFEGNVLYFTEAGDSSEKNGKISKIDLSKDNPLKVNLFSDVARPFNILINNNNLYVVEASGQRVYKIDITSLSPEIIELYNTDSGLLTGLAIKNDYLYFSNLHTGKIFKINVKEENPLPIIVDETSTTYGLAFYESNLIVAEHESGKIVKFGKQSLRIKDILSQKKLNVINNYLKHEIEINGINESISLKIFDLNGKKVADFIIADNVYKINTEEYRPGVYFIIIDENYSYKFIR